MRGVARTLVVRAALATTVRAITACSLSRLDQVTGCTRPVGNTRVTSDSHRVAQSQRVGSRRRECFSSLGSLAVQLGSLAEPHRLTQH